MTLTSLDVDAAYHRAMDEVKYRSGTADPADLDTLREAGRADLVDRIGTEAAYGEATDASLGLVTHIVVGEGQVFGLRISRLGDGWGWHAEAEGHDLTRDGHRVWANQRLAWEDAVATLEKELG